MKTTTDRQRTPKMAERLYEQAEREYLAAKRKKEAIEAMVKARIAGPKQTMKCYMATGIFEAIVDAAEADDPFSQELTNWAYAATRTETYGWMLEHYDTDIVIQWPDYPMGRDNERLHGLWDRLKKSYRRWQENMEWQETSEYRETRAENQESIDAARMVASEQRHAWSLAAARRW